LTPQLYGAITRIVRFAWGRITIIRLNNLNLIKNDKLDHIANGRVNLGLAADFLQNSANNLYCLIIALLFTARRNAKFCLTVTRVLCEQTKEPAVRPIEFDTMHMKE